MSTRKGMFGGKEIEGYTYEEARKEIGAKYINYVRQLVAKGKIGIEGTIPQKEGSEVKVVLLKIADVEAYAKHFNTRGGSDGKNTYEIKMSAEEAEELKAQGYELRNVTEARREYHAKRATQAEVEVA